MQPPGIANRLLTAGVSLSLSHRYGTDAKGNKTYIEQALWIGANFGVWGKTGYLVGDWGLTLLDRLGRFALVDDRLCLVIQDGDVDALVEATILNAAEHNPLLKPLPYRPWPWTGFRAGCLSPEHWAKVQLVSSNHPSTENIIRHAIANGRMQPVLDAINFLQDVPLAINRPILDLVKRVSRPAPPTDAEIDRKVAQKKARHKKRSKKAIRAEIESEYRAGLYDWEFDMALADWSACRDRFHVGLCFDFRGRLVPICGLSVYRSDHVRGMLQFADGEVISPEGVQWLKQFVARLADGNGFSDETKPSRLDFDSRLAWTERNLPTILHIGAAALYGDSPDLNGIDDRFQFAAACAELAGVMAAVGDGSDFITRLPIQFDASCSGLQHLCAMVRADEGKYVNLSPPPPDRYVSRPLSYKHDELGTQDCVPVNVGPDDAVDIYTLIARELALRYPPFGDLPETRQRKVVKQPIMTMMYGAGVRRQAKQIEEIWLRTNTKDLAEAIRVRDRAYRVPIQGQWLGVSCPPRSSFASICAPRSRPRSAAPRPFDSYQSSDLPIVFQMTHCVLCSRIVRAHDNRSGQ
jgi:hypothetical protein